MTAYERPLARYRPCVGVMLVNPQGLVFAGRRADMKENAWQMPQGGIDDGEAPRDAARRELHEEAGTDKAEFVAETPRWHHYDLPPEARGRLWRGGYRGQAQKWFLLRFTGSDGDIRLDAHHGPEFSAWRWVRPDELPDLAVSFKRAVYRDVLAEFRPLLLSLWPAPP